jgi:hypothetical protein
LTIRAVGFYSRIKGWLERERRMNRRQFGRIAAAAAALRFTPSFAQRVDKAADQLTNGEFNWRPDRSPTDGADDQSDVLNWQATDLGATAKATGEDNGAALRRIKADPAAREAVRKRLKFGMTIVTTDQPADARTRSGDGFVVLDSQS